MTAAFKPAFRLPVINLLEIVKVKIKTCKPEKLLLCIHLGSKILPFKSSKFFYLQKCPKIEFYYSFLSIAAASDFFV